MARSDLLLGLTKSALAGDVDQSRAIVESIAADERRKRHSVLAGQLLDELSATPRRPLQRSLNGSTPEPPEPEFLREVPPKRRLADLALELAVRNQVEQIVEEQHRADLLRTYGVEPRHKILLVGPSGNGKTSLAEAVAAELSLPFYVLRYEQVLTSFLGETAARLESALGIARSQHCVLFLDEFDVVGKERGDEHDAGEIKRVVSSLLLQLDRLPSHVVLIAATNHPQLLDSAIWRRFELQLMLDAPDSDRRAEFAADCAHRLRLSLSVTQLSRLLAGLGDVSYADIESALSGLRRREILLGPSWTVASAKREVTDALKAWESRPGR